MQYRSQGGFNWHGAYMTNLTRFSSDVSHEIKSDNLKIKTKYMDTYVSQTMRLKNNSETHMSVDPTSSTSSSLSSLSPPLLPFFPSSSPDVAGGWWHFLPLLPSSSPDAVSSGCQSRASSPSPSSTTPPSPLAAHGDNGCCRRQARRG